ncbi:hypothetical protein MIMGU_mgv1a020463mg [Erythranthe guttata]|uniref:Coenzyme Q-binding protein COQ10 START domain-containing protein n=1 Tax=Erythranthe guttata TaxID=4155 RepID=A0A022Q156_ERYGU|nr:hypothetical protein MIMGU_mgv1a020463mg [Erythranthe guttata]
MTLLFSTTATPSRASTNMIPKLSIARRCPVVYRPFIVVDAESAFPPRRLNPYGPATKLCLKIVKTLHPRFRAYFGGDSENAPDAEDGENSEDDAYELPADSEIQDDSIEIEIEKTGKNSRIIRSKVAVQASLQTVWNTLTDYERLADFIPGLAVSQLLEKRDNFARLFQIGEQNLAFGLKFNAKATIDCFEKDLQTLPYIQKRDIEFKMVEGDFQLFEGKWSVEQVRNFFFFSCGEEFQTTLLYILRVKPKVWLPVQLVEGRLCNEIRTNLSCIRNEAEKVFSETRSTL